MKNKLKKSKIIVPALALITATTVASVTGTVAWFTAARTATVNASAFATAKVDSTLNVSITADANSGTFAGTANSSVNVPGKITHGSYNATSKASGSLYVANLDDSKTVTGYKDLKGYSSVTSDSNSHLVTSTESGSSTTTNYWLAKTATTDADKVWYGVSWKMSFTYTATVDNETNYLLFDVNGSKFEDKTTGGQTLQGLRIAFMTTDKFLVVGGNTTETHTTGTSTSNTASYNTNYTAISATTAKLNDGDTSLSTSALNLGVLPSNGTTALEVVCVAWFEGSDSNIVNTINSTETVMSKVETTLEFYSRKA